MLTELMSVLSGIESLTTLVFYGHDFEVLSFGEVPENLVNLVFESSSLFSRPSLECVIGSIEVEEDVATPIETVIFQSSDAGSLFPRRVDSQQVHHPQPGLPRPAAAEDGAWQPQGAGRGGRGGGQRHRLGDQQLQISREDRHRQGMLP